MIRIRLMLVLICIGAVRIDTAQRRPASGSVATVVVQTLSALSAMPLIEARVELLTKDGKSVVRFAHSGGNKISAKSEGAVTTQTGVRFVGVRYGKYLLRVERSGSFPFQREISIDKPEHWFTVALHGISPWEPDPTGPIPFDFSIRIEERPSGDEPVWAKLIGIYSSEEQESRIDDNGIAHFRVNEGQYVLLVLKGTSVCAITEFEPPYKPEPVSVHIREECLRPK